MALLAAMRVVPLTNVLQSENGHFHLWVENYLAENCRSCPVAITLLKILKYKVSDQEFPGQIFLVVVDFISAEQKIHSSWHYCAAAVSRQALGNWNSYLTDTQIRFPRTVPMRSLCGFSLGSLVFSHHFLFQPNRN